MSRSFFHHLSAALLVVAFAAAPAAAANKEHQQMMADIRMLQEQQQRLQLQLASLTEVLKTVTSKLDEAASTNRKLFADQKLLIDNIAGDLRVVREKADDNNTRLGTLSLDVEAIHNALLQAPGTAGGAVPPGGAATAGGVPPSGAPTTTPAQPPSGGQLGVLPSQLRDQAFSDYTRGQYQLARDEYEKYLAAYPNASDAADAQLYIAKSFKQEGKFSDAIAAYTKVITNYASSSRVPEAYFERGSAYESAGDKARARQDYEYLISHYPPDNTYVLLAKQRVQADDEEERDARE